MFDDEKRTKLKKKIDDLLRAAQEYIDKLQNIKARVDVAKDEAPIVDEIVATMEQAANPMDQLKGLDLTRPDHKDYIVKVMSKFSTKDGSPDVDKWAKAVVDGKFPEPPR